MFRNTCFLKVKFLCTSATDTNFARFFLPQKILVVKLGLCGQHFANISRQNELTLTITKDNLEFEIVIPGATGHH